MNRKTAGIILIVIGLVLFFALIATVTIADYRKWALNLDGFHNRYPSFVGLLYSREKGAFLISTILGLLPVSLGTILIRDGKYR